ncbi:hypothetical protein Tco_0633355 [Tanacetum coccineum]
MFVRGKLCALMGDLNLALNLDDKACGASSIGISMLDLTVSDHSLLVVNIPKDNLHERVNTLLHEFDEANKSLYIDSSDIELCEDEATYLVAINEALNEEHFLKQKAKIECLRVGLQIAHVLIYSLVFRVWLGLGMEGATSPFMNIELFSKCFSSERAEPMVCQVSNEEIKDDMLSMGDNKSLGPHGFSTKGA